MFFRRLIIFIFMFTLTVPVLAQYGEPPVFAFPDLSGGEIILSGLSVPIGVHVDHEGNVWVLDSGFGGSKTIDFINPMSFAQEEATFGHTAQLVKLAPNDKWPKREFLPSIQVGPDMIGGARVVGLNGVLYLSYGQWFEGNMGEIPPLFGSIVKYEDGEFSVVADLWAYEEANNPDGTDLVDSHPYGLAVGPDGMLYVTDAAANDLLRVDPSTGLIETVAVFDGIESPTPTDHRGGAYESDPVPTGITIDADGTMYVSLLTGFPFVEGSAKVLKVSPDGEVSEFASGLSMLSDITRGPDGYLYATQFAVVNELEKPAYNSGAIIRIMEDGSWEVMVAGLPFPTGIAFSADGNAYVTVSAAILAGNGRLIFYEDFIERDALDMDASS
ncbi:hypothetical protein MASR2M15_28700 [Anaerolineales bacterium]